MAKFQLYGVKADECKKARGTIINRRYAFNHEGIFECDDKDAAKIERILCRYYPVVRIGQKIPDEPKGTPGPVADKAVADKAVADKAIADKAIADKAANAK